MDIFWEFVIFVTSFSIMVVITWLIIRKPGSSCYLDVEVIEETETDDSTQITKKGCEEDE